MNDSETLEPKIIERGTNSVKARINFQRKIKEGRTRKISSTRGSR